MAKPIKDRGIFWKERYGEKSAHLKKEMDEQIGPGSYYRWEGHDHTTGNDYYVVVSPGYSKKKGYFFFAGLRKMPADHGASGKKFSTQREAMSHAFDTWGVPRPTQRPAKPYTRDDLVNKQIVLESQHKSASADKPKRTVIVADKQQKQAMSIAYALMNYCSLGHKWTRNASQKQMVDFVCNAIRHSGTMGFLAGLNTHINLAGIEGANFDNKNNLPFSPLMATSETPDEKVYEQYVQPRWTKQMFLKPKKRGPLGRTTYEIEQPPRGELDGKYRYIRWRDVKIYMNVQMESDSAFKNFLKQWGANVPQETRRFESLKPWDVAEGKKDESSLFSYNATVRQGKGPFPTTYAYQIGIAPDYYYQFVQDLQDWRERNNFRPGTMEPQVIKTQQSYALYLAQQNGVVDLDQPIGAERTSQGSELLAYDNQDMPVCLPHGNRSGSALVPISREDAVPEDMTKHEEQLRDSLNGAKRLIADHVNSATPAVGAAYDELMQVEQLAKEKKAGHDQVASAWQKLQQAVEKSSTEGVDAGIQAEFLRLCGEYIDARVEYARYVAAEIMPDAKTRKPSALSAQRAKMMDAHAKVAPYLKGFKAMAAVGKLRFIPSRFVHAETCAPVTAPFWNSGYDVNAAGLPKNLSEKPTPRLLVQPSPLMAAAKDGKFQARRPVVGGYNNVSEELTDLPEGVSPRQTVSGAEVSVAGAHYAFLEPPEEGAQSAYSMNVAGRTGVTRYIPNSKGMFIPGGAYVVHCRIQGSSPKKSKGGLSVMPGWVVERSRLQVIEDDGAPRTGAQQTTMQAFGRNEHSGLFSLQGEDGESIPFDVNASDRKDSPPLFASSEHMLKMVKQRFCLGDDVMPAITKMDLNDLFIAQDKWNTALEINNLLRMESQQKLGLEQQKTLDQMRESPEFEEMAKFGELCAFCEKRAAGGMGDYLNEPVMNMIQEALKNPRKAMRPRRGTLWAVQYTDKDGNVTLFKYEGSNEPAMFSSGLSWWAKGAIDAIEKQGLGSNPKIIPYKRGALLVPSIDKTGRLVENGEELERKIYVERGEEPPAEEWGDDTENALAEWKDEPYSEEDDTWGDEEDEEDKFEQQYPDYSVEEASGEGPPEAPEIPGFNIEAFLKTFEAMGAEQAEKIVAALKTRLPGHADYFDRLLQWKLGKGAPAKQPEQPQPEQRTEQQPAPQAALQPAPSSDWPQDKIRNVEKAVEIWIREGNLSQAEEAFEWAKNKNAPSALLHTLSRMLQHSRPTQPAPQTPPQEAPSPAVRQPTQAATEAIAKLIRLANRLDEEGRHKEADAVDRLIKISIRKR